MTKPTSQLRESIWREWVNPAFVEEWIGVLVDEVKPSRGGGGFQPTVRQGWDASGGQEKHKTICKRSEAWAVVGCPM